MEKIMQEFIENDNKGNNYCQLDNLVIIDYGKGDLGYSVYRIGKNGKPTRDYEGIISNDILDYTFEENVKMRLFNTLTEDQKTMFKAAYYGAKSKAVRHEQEWFDEEEY